MAGLSKRDALKLVGAAALGVAATPARAAPSATGLVKMTGGAVSISPDERRARIAKAQTLMQQQGVAALVLESGSALTYFTGVKWSRSERFTGAVIPREGPIAVVTPFFEEPSVRETLLVGDDVRTWNEHENPFALVADVLRDRKLSGGKLAFEETVRYFIVDGVAKAAPGFKPVNGASVTRGVRMFKSPAEIALLQLASDVTMAAMRYVRPRVAAGMTNRDVAQMMDEATAALGGENQFSLVLVGEASAYPHGSKKPQVVGEGQVVLMDCGCTVGDYQSDISRTFVFGAPTKKQREVWATVKEGQERALAAMKIGAPTGSVDDTVRAFYVSKGYGPAYKLPGLSHRVGHGIGMDGHEPVNFVHGETTTIQPGMCFSDEPGLYLPGEFGVRLEDCVHITPTGPKLFSGLAPSIDDPIG